MTSTDTATSAGTMELAPYIFFYGRCEEALKFYKAVLGGSYELQRVSESPMADSVPADFRDKVMHATFTAPGLRFLAGDGREAKPINPDEGNISLSLEFNDAARGKEVFNALSEGGKVVMPLESAFWGGQFGVLNDRFGNEWMITTP